MNTTIGVVVLNYKKYDETINCVNSLIKQSVNNIHIVIVDNGSQNNSYEILVEKYKSVSCVEVIPSTANIGYAKGNNLGIKRLLDIGIRNIFIANSDLFFSGENTLIQMINSLDDEIGVIVPTIKNPDGGYDQRVIYKKRLFPFRMAKELMKSILKDLMRISSKMNRDYVLAREDNNILYDDSYVVSGSGFLLTEHFFEHYYGLFSDTFLYGEECGTIILLHKAGLSTKVVNTDVIIHKGGASTPIHMKELTRERRKINLDSDRKLFRLLFTPRIMIKGNY